MTTPATCTSRTRGGYGHIYDCDQPAGHDGAHHAHIDGEWVAGWTDAVAIRPDAAEVMRAATPTAQQAGENLRGAMQAAPVPVQRTDAERDQHRRTLRFILDRLDRGKAPTAVEVSNLRRVVRAEQAENDDARRLAAGLATSAGTYARRYEQQTERTRKARQQRDDQRTCAEAGERTAAERLDRIRALQAERAARRHDIADALGVSRFARWDQLVPAVRERVQQHADSLPPTVDRRAQLAQRLGLDTDVSWPDLFAAVGAHTYARQLAEQRADERPIAVTLHAELSPEQVAAAVRTAARVEGIGHG